VLNWLAVTYDQTANRGQGAKAQSADSAGAAPFTSDEVARLRHVPLESVLATRNAVVRDLAATGPAPPSRY
jgi:hypothetical protein